MVVVAVLLLLVVVAVLLLFVAVVVQLLFVVAAQIRTAASCTAGLRWRRK